MLMETGPVCGQLQFPSQAESAWHSEHSSPLVRPVIKFSNNRTP